MIITIILAVYLGAGLKTLRDIEKEDSVRKFNRNYVSSVELLLIRIGIVWAWPLFLIIGE